MLEAQRGWDLSKTGVACLTYDTLPTSKERTDGATDKIADGLPERARLQGPTKTDSTMEGGFDATNTLAAHPDEVLVIRSATTRPSVVSGPSRQRHQVRVSLLSSTTATSLPSVS